MKLGSLCSGAGGLDMAVEQVFGAETVWHCETDKAASKVLTYRWPGVPNHGDLISTDWTQVKPVDIVCAGWPCQPWSQAGKRKGAEDERAIWPHIRDAVRLLRPRFVVLENVPAVVGIGELWRVCNDLSAFGYDLRWVCLRASGVSAPHRRERLFLLAHAECVGCDCGISGSPLKGVQTTGLGDGAGTSVADSSRARSNGRPLLPTPRSQDGNGYQQRPDADVGNNGRTVSLADRVTRLGGDALLPTPAVNDIGEGKTIEWWDEWCVKSKAAHGNGNGHGNSLAIEAQRLLPTPVVTDAASSGRHTTTADAMHPGTSLTDAIRLLPTPQSQQESGHGGGARNLREVVNEGELLSTPQARDFKGVPSLNFNEANLCRDIADTQRWGKYRSAIHRWEQLTRPAPPPTELNRNNKPRLNPAFSEWMMGWPAGWVTDPAIGISRNDQLRIIGNGVVPQQAVAALQWLLSVEAVAS